MKNIGVFSPPRQKTQTTVGSPTTGSPSWSSSTWVVMEVQRQHPMGWQPVSLRLPTFRFGGVVFWGAPQQDPQRIQKFAKKTNRVRIMWIQLSSEYIEILKLVYLLWRTPIHDDQSSIARWISDVEHKNVHVLEPPIQKICCWSTVFNFPTKRWRSAVQDSNHYLVELFFSQNHCLFHVLLEAQMLYLSQS